ncbi:nuclear transport factor 2 family protein [Paenirhodobacter ferrireducens]|nr:nuclear transport factor 2 family protein [Sinirhodobacter ferrireducens]
MDKLQILDDWFQRVWIGGAYAEIGSFYTEDFLASGVMPGLELRPTDFAELIPALKEMISDPSVTYLRHFENDEWLWTLMLIRGRAAETHAPLELTAQIALRFEGDKIAEAHNHFDVLAFLEGVGMLPPDTLALCLAGEHLD